MFKTFTVLVSHDEDYGSEIKHYHATFATEEAANAAFLEVADVFNIEVNSENVKAGYANRPMDNDYGDDYTLEICVIHDEVYASYEEEREAHKQLIASWAERLKK